MLVGFVAVGSLGFLVGAGFGYHEGRADGATAAGVRK